MSATNNFALTAYEEDILQTFMDMINSTNKAAATSVLVSSGWNLDDALFQHTLRISCGSDGEYETFGASTSSSTSPSTSSHSSTSSTSSSASSSSSTPYNSLLANFSQKFNLKYNCSLTFFSEPLQKALQSSQRLCKPVLFFITNFNSCNSKSFIKKVVLNKTVSQSLENNCIIFPWDITRKEHLETFTTELRANGLHSLAEFLENFAQTEKESFPILLPVPPVQGDYDIPPFVESTDSVDAAIAKLLVVAQEFEALNPDLAEKKREREEREEIRRIQEEEYQASLKKDLERLEKLKLEEERKQKEMEEAERLKVEEATRKEKLERELPTEPAATEPGVMTVKFRLPEGKQTTRRFRPTESIETLICFLGSQGFSPEKFKYFNSDFPKRNIMEKFAQHQSFSEAAWPVREQIFVEEI